MPNLKWIKAEDVTEPGYYILGWISENSEIDIRNKMFYVTKSEICLNQDYSTKCNEGDFWFHYTNPSVSYPLSEFFDDKECVLFGPIPNKY